MNNVISSRLLEYANDTDKLLKIISDIQSYTEAHTVLDMWCKSLTSFLNKIENIQNISGRISIDIHQIYMSNSYAIFHLPRLKIGLELMSREELHFKNENKPKQDRETEYEYYESHFNSKLEEKGITIRNIGRDVYINSSIDSITNIEELLSSCIDKVNENEKLSDEDKTKTTSSLKTLNVVYDNIKEVAPDMGGKLIRELIKSLLSL